MISVLFIVYLYRYLCSLICTSSKYQSFVHSFALRSHRQCELPFKQCSYDNHSPQGGSLRLPAAIPSTPSSSKCESASYHTVPSPFLATPTVCT